MQSKLVPSEYVPSVVDPLCIVNPIHIPLVPLLFQPWGDGWDVAVVNSDEEMFDIIEGNKKLQHADNPYWLGGTTQINHGKVLVLQSLPVQTPVQFPDSTVFSMADIYSTDEASK